MQYAMKIFQIHGRVRYTFQYFIGKRRGLNAKTRGAEARGAEHICVYYCIMYIYGQNGRVVRQARRCAPAWPPPNAVIVAPPNAGSVALHAHHLPPRATQRDRWPWDARREVEVASPSETRVRVGRWMDADTTADSRGLVRDGWRERRAEARSHLTSRDEPPRRRARRLAQH